MQYTINNADWTQISRAGKNITARLDEQDDGASGSVDIRVYCSIEKPALTDEVMTQSKRIYKPTSNEDSLPLTPNSHRYSFWARAAKVGDVATVIADESGVGCAFKMDVSIQDPTNPYAPSYFVNELGSAATASIATIDTRTVTLASGHGFVDGTAGQIFVIEGYYAGLVISVVGDVITVDTPFNYTYPIGTTVKRGDINMNKDGSVTRLVYVYRPGANREFDTKEIRIGLIDSTTMGDGLFGGDTPKTNGLVIRVKKSNTWYNTIANVKTNGDVRLYGELEYSDKPPADKFGCTFKFPLETVNGAICRTLGDGIQEIQIIVQDDYRGLDKMIALAPGHVVED